MKRIILIILIIVIVATAIMLGYFKYNRTYIPNDVKFSDADIHYGCYWGDIHQKKSGTPENWVLVYPGTHSAQWCDPVKANSLTK